MNWKTSTAIRLVKNEQNDPQGIQEVYASHGTYSSVYDRVVLSTPWYLNLLSKYIDVLKQSYKREDSFTIADLGGGTGNLLHWIKHFFPKSKGTLIDASPSMTKAALAKGIKESEIQISQIFELRGPDHQFDVITCNNVLYHLRQDDLQKTLSEISRVLKPNGLFIVAGPRAWNSDRQEQFTRRVKEQFQRAVQRRMVSQTEADQALQNNLTLSSKFQMAIEISDLEKAFRPYSFQMIQSSKAYDGLVYFGVFQKKTSAPHLIESQTHLSTTGAKLSLFHVPCSIEPKKLPKSVSYSLERIVQSYGATPEKDALEKVLRFEKKHLDPCAITPITLTAPGEKLPSAFTSLYDGNAATLPVERFFPVLTPSLRNGKKAVFEIKRGVAWKKIPQCSNAFDLLLAGAGLAIKSRGYEILESRLVGCTLSDKVTQYFMSRYGAKILRSKKGDAHYRAIEFPVQKVKDLCDKLIRERRSNYSR